MDVRPGAHKITSEALLEPSANNAPRLVADLRVAMLAGGTHLECFGGVCTAVDVGEQDWSRGSAGDPHLLLIESSGLRAQSGGRGPIAQAKVERAAELIGWADRHGVATALWETALARRIQ